MNRTGRAIAFFRAKEQGPQISRRLREFSSRMPSIDFSLGTPSSLDGDIGIRTCAKTFSDSGANAVLEAREPDMPGVIVAGQLKAVLTLFMADLIESPRIIYKENGEYKLISSEPRNRRQSLE